MRISLAFFGVLLSVLVTGCSAVTEQDLADLQSPNAIVKTEAIHRISRGKGFSLPLIDGLVNRADEEAAVALMVESLRSGKESKDMQMSILKALGVLGKRRKVPFSPLVEKLKDKDPGIRAHAIEAVGKTRNKEALTALIRLLEEDTDKYRIIWAFGEIGDKRAIPTLNSLLASNDVYVRYNAYRALAKIGTHQMESAAEVNSNTNSPVDLGKVAFKRYQDMMMIVFQKIADLKRA